MDSRQLRYFAAIYDYGSLSTAGEHLRLFDPILVADAPGHIEEFVEVVDLGRRPACDLLIACDVVLVENALSGLIDTTDAL